MARKFSELTAKMDPARVQRAAERTKAMLEELPLQELRRARDYTQTRLAEALDISQGDVSKLEHRTDIYVSTLRSYVEAMGGKLEIVARFSDREIKIGRFGEIAA
jgi:DNA-binding XRE family transcriptional regulator